jgi:GT2 family glycosyltransferase
VAVATEGRQAKEGGEATRPRIDVVVPFAGSQNALDDLLERLSGIRLNEGDSLAVVDNRAEGGGSPASAAIPVTVIAARERRSSYFARNAGARRGVAEWILFIDSDVEPPADLLDRYFAHPPSASTGVLAGAIVDEGPLPGRLVRARSGLGHLDQEGTLGRGPWAYAQTANCAVRRSAFETVGGFVAEIRSGGDADLCYRLRDAGWTIEARQGAKVVHHGRTTVRGFLRQVFRHGAGAAWLNAVHPGSAPPERWRNLAGETARAAAAIPYRLLVSRERDRAVARLIETLALWSFALGRLGSNRPTRRPVEADQSMASSSAV